MGYLYVKHKVKNFGKQSIVLNSHKYVQKDYGLVDLQLFRDKNDPNDIIVIFRIENMKKARAFVSAPIAEDAKDESCVMGEPECLFLDKV